MFWEKTGPSLVGFGGGIKGSKDSPSGIADGSEHVTKLVRFDPSYIDGKARYLSTFAFTSIKMPQQVHNNWSFTG